MFPKSYHDMLAVKKAVIPAAGFGTRLLPGTKSQPKEMIPIVDKPVIQYVIEEAVDAGITDILMVIGKGKRAIEEHFDRNFELEYSLQQKGRTKELELIRRITDMANIHFIWQKELNGLGDAVRYGRLHIGDEPFVVLLGDTILQGDNNVNITKQIIDVYEAKGGSVVALEKVPPELVYRYGVMDGSRIDDGNLYRVNGWVEKPAVGHAPSDLVVAGRYVFTSRLWPLLDQVPTTVNNEIQLTSAMHLLAQEEQMFGLHFEGRRYDIGNKLDFIKTNLVFGLQHEEFRDELRVWLKDFIKEL